jgi:hypothetical protein
MRLSICIAAAPDTRTLLAGAAALLTVAVCGCSTTTGPGMGTTGPSTGSLTVTIVAPGGVTPAVTVTGPGSYSKVLTATTTLTGLTFGSYDIVAAPVSTANAIVGTVYTGSVTGSPAPVSAGLTFEVLATYTQLGGTGGLWIANLNSSQTVQFSASQLAGTTSAPAAIAVNTALSTTSVWRLMRASISGYRTTARMRSRHTRPTS